MDVKDGGRFDWERDNPAAIERMLSEKYAFMAAVQAMYLESSELQQFSVFIPTLLL